jgi:hypothetical protein
MKVWIPFLSAVLFASVLMIGAGVPTAAAGELQAEKACATAQTATAACGKCGDGRCTPQCGETAESCPKDCGVVSTELAACGKCGDGRCTPQCGETSLSCPKDCGVETQQTLLGMVR